MIKTKFFSEETIFGLQSEVNSFIKNKTIINISYSVTQCGYGYIHCCCVLYKE